MSTMRPACSDDVPGVTAVIAARSAWMAEQGLPSWRDVVDDLAAQAAVPGTAMWVLTAAERVVGCTTMVGDKPLWGWTAEESEEDSYSSVHHLHGPGLPRCQARIADRVVGGGQGRRRGPGVGEARHRRAGPRPVLPDPGFEPIHEVQRKNSLVYLMARRAQRLPEVERVLTAGWTVAVS